MQRYEAYKDSGVEWIGEIPAGWEVWKMKHLAQIDRGGSPRPIEDYLSDSGYNWIKIGDATDSGGRIKRTAQKIKPEGLPKTRLVKPGALLLTNSMSFGRPYILEIEGCIHDGWLAIAPISEMLKEYLCYFLESDSAYRQFLASVDGSVVQNLSIDKVKDSYATSPPLPEQQAIADYLDAKTAQIDSIVSQTERSIELLREYRKSVISEAVTKGLDPDAPMKDSGVEWIGEIPAGWEISKGKALYDITTGKLDVNAGEDDGAFPFFTCSMQPRRINEYAFDCEALLVAGNGIVGFTQYYKGKFNAYQRTYVLSNFRNMYPGFLRYYVSNNLMTEVAPNSVGSVIQFIKIGDLRNFIICAPSLPEQRAIADYLDEKTAEIDSLIADKQRQVELLKEYRKSLISEAVTGKFKVPGLE